MQINEIFLTINGETLNTIQLPGKIGAGVPTIFIRTNNCSIKCRYCDSVYTMTESGTEMTVEQILNKVAEVGKKYHTVCISGGEPELQPMGEMHQLIRGLKDRGYTVSIEASGTADRDFFFGADCVVMDVKGPSAGPKAMGRTKKNIEYVRSLKMQDQLKFLVKDRVDFDWMIEWLTNKTNILAIDSTIRPQILVSPVFDKEGNSNAAEVVEWLLKSGLDATLNYQIHKQIWSPSTRGV